MNQSPTRTGRCRAGSVPALGRSRSHRLAINAGSRQHVYVIFATMRFVRTKTGMGKSIVMDWHLFRHVIAQCASDAPMRPEAVSIFAMNISTNLIWSGRNGRKRYIKKGLTMPDHDTTWQRTEEEEMLPAVLFIYFYCSYFVQVQVVLKFHQLFVLKYFETPIILYK